MITLISYALKNGHVICDKKFNLMGVARPTRRLALKHDGRSMTLKLDLFLKDRVYEQYDSYLGMIIKMLEENDDIIIGLYCDDGKYRSVAFAEIMKTDIIRLYPNIMVKVIHRDIKKS